MRRFRIGLISMIAGMASAAAVLWIASLIEQRRAQEYMARLRSASSLVSDHQGGAVAVVQFAPGLLTWCLVALAFGAVFYWTFRWQDR
jgi:hypothetical protein